MFLLCACMFVSFPGGKTHLYIWVACWIYFFFHFQSISLIYSLVHENTGIRFAAQVFSFLPPHPGSKFALTILHCLNFLSLFSVEMFWSLLQVLIPSSSLTPSTSGECGIVDKSSWQHSKSNHFPPDVRVWEGTKREWKEGGRNQLPPLPVPPIYMKSPTPPFLRLPISSPSLPSAEKLTLPSHSQFYTYCLPIPQEAARAGSVYRWGNWSSLERAWP